MNSRNLLIPRGNNVVQHNETVYEEGVSVRKADIPINHHVACTVAAARAKAGISQAVLSAETGIDQSDISKIERGVGNPSIGTLNRLAHAMGME